MTLCITFILNDREHKCGDKLYIRHLGQQKYDLTTADAHYILTVEYVQTQRK